MKQDMLTLARYLRERSSGWAPGTLKEARECLRHFEPYSEGGLSRDGVMRFLAAIRARPWSWRRLRNVLSCVHGLLRWAWRTGETLEDLAILIVPPRGLSLPRPLSFEEVVRLLDRGCPTHKTRDRAILELLYGTGVRRAELLGLTLSDLDLSERLLRVRRGKGGKDRLVPFGESLREVLLRYLREERAGLPGEALFVTSSGRRLKRGALFKIVAGASVKAGLARPASPHRLRHSYATHLLRGGAGIVSVKALLGHARLDTTALYTEVDVGDLRTMLQRSHPRERRKTRSASPE